MSNHGLFRISADLPPEIRAQLLRRFPPRFPQVFCKTITWAYKVPETFVFASDPLWVQVWGYHASASAEALLVDLDQHSVRHDGERLFLTLSTAEGVPPFQAGQQIEDNNIERLARADCVEFQVQLVRRPLWKMKPN